MKKSSTTPKIEQTIYSNEKNTKNRLWKVSMAMVLRQLKDKHHACHASRALVVFLFFLYFLHRWLGMGMKSIAHIAHTTHTLTSYVCSSPYFGCVAHVLLHLFAVLRYSRSSSSSSGAVINSNAINHSD